MFSKRAAAEESGPETLPIIRCTPSFQLQAFLLAFVLALLLLSWRVWSHGSASTEEVPPPTVEPTPPPTGPLVFKQSLAVREEQRLEAGPDKAAQAHLSEPVQFRFAKTRPAGCVLDEQTGRFSWTPTELEGPGSYSLEIEAIPAKNPEGRLTFIYEINVAETNSAPILEFPKTVEVNAGEVLELPFSVRDNDFPSNKLTVKLSGDLPAEMDLDQVNKILYWKVPKTWPDGVVTVQISVRDDGTPALTTTKQLPIAVAARAAVPGPVAPPVAAHRIPDFYIDLPDLPVAPIGKRPAPLTDERAEIPLVVKGSDFTLSLIVPVYLKSTLRIEYPGESSSHFLVKAAVPFKAEPQIEGPPEGALAECAFDGTKLRWNWARSHNKESRHTQNNVRRCVIAVKSNEALHPQLVALQRPFRLPPVPVNWLLADEELKQSLVRHNDIAVCSPPDGHECKVLSGPVQFPLDSQADSAALILTSEDLRKHLKLDRLRFFVKQLPKEITLELDSQPSLRSAREHALTATRELNTALLERRKWLNRQAKAFTDYKAAERMPVRNEADARAREIKLATARREYARATNELAQVELGLPARFLLKESRDKARAAVESLFLPIADHKISGELCCLIGDVRVVIVEISSDLDEPPKGEPPAGVP